MSDTWLTYAEAAERLGTTVEAVRQREIRGRWKRTQGNDGKAWIMLPDGERTPSERPARTRVQPPPSERTDAERLVAALEAHNETLKGELAAAPTEALSEKIRADKAIADCVRLAEQLAASRAPWWPRVVGG
ncbi:MAG: hypothetical protein O9972_45105 [Burkholderiales bacterium]|nr:hypothetical protein [Burkholderiales bacterium]